MLLQLGVTPAVATFLSALLFVPWVLKSFMRLWVSRVGDLRPMLHFIEALLSVCLLFLAFAFNQGPVLVFIALMLVSLLCAWHELAARMYYQQTLRPSVLRLLTNSKLVVSQVVVIFTYGALIFLVGTLEVYFRQIRYSWSLACYVAAGLFMLFAFLHLLTLAPSKRQLPIGSKAIGGRKHRSVIAWKSLLFLFLLLLPQGLMFHVRVLYLFDAHAHGGLQCTMQEIGFAQGTVGVIAFSIGIALGRWFFTRMDNGKWTMDSYQLPKFMLMALSIVLSPFVYLGMTIWPPQTLFELCCCTMLAQLLFGLGLGVCRLPISAISGIRYRNTINMLQIPLVSAAMFVPMAISGWLVEQLGYNTYFLVNALSAPICLLGIFLLRTGDKWGNNS